MNRQIFTVTAMNIAALAFCAVALQQLSSSPQLLTKALLMSQIPMLLAALGGLSCIHAEWLKSQSRRRAAFGALPLQEQVRHASWLATLPNAPRAGI